MCLLCLCGVRNACVYGYVRVSYVYFVNRILSVWYVVRVCIQGGLKVLHQKIFKGRAGCREQCEVGYPCPEMNSNAATGTFFA